MKEWMEKHWFLTFLIICSLISTVAWIIVTSIRGYAPVDTVAEKIAADERAAKRKQQQVDKDVMMRQVMSEH